MMELGLNKIIEALLFVSEKPLTIKQIQEVCPETNVSEIKKTINQLKESYSQPERGIQIIEVAGGYQFCSHPDCEPYLSKLYKTKKIFRLSAPALETLAIIAYKQPVTKAEMEFIRGVNVDGVVKSLEDRELIKIKGRKDVPGRPILYGTTDKFLHYFGLKSLEDMPSLEEFAAQALEREEKLEADPQENTDEVRGEGQSNAEENTQEEDVLVIGEEESEPDQGSADDSEADEEEEAEIDEDDDVLLIDDEQDMEIDIREEDADDAQLQTGENDNEQDEHTEIAKSN